MTNQYDKLKSATFWTLLPVLVLAWAGPLSETSDLSDGPFLPVLAVGSAGLVAFSFLYVRVLRLVLAQRPAVREVAAAAVIAVLVALVAGRSAGANPDAVIGWGIILPCWAGLAALIQSRWQAVVTVLLTAPVIVLITVGEQRAGVYIGLTVGLVWGNRFQLWFWEVVKAAHEGKEAQAKLAVTEERLRFSRDLHDTVGHSLSAIAVKSELAARLAEADAGRAAEEMTEVRRLARESLREIRAVVRGYRSVDLEAELRSVRAVLEAAGIRCTLELAAGELPEELGTLLAWVVRESTTNVLRHSTATYCRIVLGAEDGRVTLEIVNNGVGAGDGSRGTGLAGMTERVTALGGVLTVGPGKAGEFRVRASVPADRRGRP